VRLDGKPGDGARGENDNVGRGIDVVYGGSADDLLIGNDHLGHVLFGGPGADTLKGGARNDVLLGGSGSDILIGGDRSDYLSGQRGNDRILAGSGRDTCLGGSGNDVFFVRDRLRDLVGGGPGTDRARIDVGLDRVRRVEQRF
jgi:Ca2+-binding RTX toxin-like protein